jgi:bacteriocin-like protein
MTNANKTTAPGKQDPTSEELSEEELNHVTGGDAAPPTAKQPSGEPSRLKSKTLVLTSNLLSVRPGLCAARSDLAAARAQRAAMQPPRRRTA